MTSSYNSGLRNLKRRAVAVLDSQTHIPIQCQGASLAVVNAESVGHGRFLGFWTVKEIYVRPDSERRGFPGPAAQLVHPTSFLQHPLAELVSPKGASTAARIIILTVSVIAMLGAALGFGDRMAELGVTMPLPDAVARVGRSTAGRRAIILRHVDRSVRAAPRMTADVHHAGGLIAAAHSTPTPFIAGDLMLLSVDIGL